jgi:hypothetical protein
MEQQRPDRVRRLRQRAPDSVTDTHNRAGFMYATSERFLPCHIVIVTHLPPPKTDGRSATPFLAIEASDRAEPWTPGGRRKRRIVVSPANKRS